MLPFLVAAQLAVTDPVPDSGALHSLVARAAERNRAAPASLLGYRAQVESEIAMLARRADGEEGALSLEQSQNEVHWQRGGEFSQHMTAYRARQAGPSLSALAVLRKSWAIPMLYGNEFGEFFGKDGMGGSAAVHPFGPEGDRVYAFSGGDTIAVIRTERRAIPLVRVLVEPRRDQATWPVVVFRGEIDLDADRAEIVRLRGQFLTLGRDGPQQKRLVVLPINVMAFVDLESVEIDGRYWLPRYQRIETHVNVRGLAEGRSVFRIVSKFRGHEVSTEERGAGATITAFGEVDLDGARGPRPHQLTMADGDTLQRPREWWTPLGEATASLRGDDFADVGAASALPSSGRRVSLRAQRLADLVRFNRVEGWSTGATVEYAPGAKAPDATVRANATWAWTERVVRGRVEAVRGGDGNGWRAGLRAGRTLDITNDFTAPRDSGGALVAALAGVDDYDYVDRTAGTLWLDVDLIPRRATLRLELGAATDRGAPARLTSGPLGSTVPLRFNRGVDAGSYARSSIAGEWNPAVNGSALATGIGVMVRYDQAGGGLDWRRATLRVNARTDHGALGYALRLDGGVLAGREPPAQQLFELGGGPAFPGYDYKEFAGDRAVAAHARALYRLPVMRSPLRLLGCTCFTSPAPALAVTLHGASLSASRAATLASIARLGPAPDPVAVALLPGVTGEPVSRPTGRVRTSAEVGLRLFGGAATVALARPLDTGGRWRTVVLLGQPW